MIKNLYQFTALVVLCGSCRLFGTDSTTPIYRGNRSLIEVKAGSNPSQMPEVLPQQTGQMSIEPRLFDLVSAGQFKSGAADFTLSENEAGFPKVIDSAADNKVVVTAPAYMGTMQSPMGHNTWVKIKVIAKNGEAANYMSLGIRKNGHKDFLAILTKEADAVYADMMYSDILQFIPLVSSTENTYTEVAENYDVTELEYITGDKESFNFGTTFRVQATPQKSQWLLDQPCDLFNADGTAGGWHSDGQVGAGSLMVDGEKLDNQLLIINTDGKLARSPDGVHWFSFGSVAKEGETAANTVRWIHSAVYGNDIWCVVNEDSSRGIRRSINYGETWSDTMIGLCSRTLGFGAGVFMVILENGKVYTSPDAEFWTEIGAVDTSHGGRLLAYKNSRWVFASAEGYTYESEDGKIWTLISQELSSHANTGWYGACYVNNYFYIFNQNSGELRRSIDGKTWPLVANIPPQTYKYDNIACCNNRLYMYREDGKACNICLLDMDGTAKIEVSETSAENP